MTQPFDIPFLLSPEVLFQEARGESVLLHLGHERYYGLDALGTRIWLRLRDGATLSAIHAEILREYQVDPEPLERDLRTLIDDFLHADLLRIAAPAP